jgi:hypothetical protein
MAASTAGVSSSASSSSSVSSEEESEPEPEPESTFESTSEPYFSFTIHAGERVRRRKEGRKEEGRGRTPIEFFALFSVCKRSCVVLVDGEIVQGSFTL